MGARAVRIAEHVANRDDIKLLEAAEREGAIRRGEHIKDCCDRLLGRMEDERVRLPEDRSSLRRELFAVLADHFYSPATPIDIPNLDDPKAYDPRRI